jgi:hypothetical protein
MESPTFQLTNPKKFRAWQELKGLCQDHILPISRLFEFLQLDYNEDFFTL